MTPYIRIILRYGAGALAAKGYLTSDGASFLATDPDVLMAAGAIIGVATEAWYAIAKRFGWAS
jgi:hypothetical protein